MWQLASARPTTDCVQHSQSCSLSRLSFVETYTHQALCHQIKFKFYFLPFSERQNEEDLPWKLTATSTLFTPFKKWRDRRIKELLAYTSCNSIHVVFVGAKPLTLTARNNRTSREVSVESSRGWQCSAEKKWPHFITDKHASFRFYAGKL